MNELFIIGPKSTESVVVPLSDVTVVSAPCPRSETLVRLVPDRFAWLPLPVASGHLLVLMLNSPGLYQAFAPPGICTGSVGGEGG